MIDVFFDSVVIYDDVFDSLYYFLELDVWKMKFVCDNGKVGCKKKRVFVVCVLLIFCEILLLRGEVCFRFFNS